MFSHDSIYDGVFSSSDTTAFLVQNVAAELGIRIPDELQIVGYDDIVFSRYLRPSLSSIRQPIKEIAYYAIDILHRELIGAEVPIKTVLPVELIERESLRSQI
jgi:DNA-binding LacI/PurR family transcriptional regulator